MVAVEEVAEEGVEWEACPVGGAGAAEVAVFQAARARAREAADAGGAEVATRRRSKRGRCTSDTDGSFDPSDRTLSSPRSCYPAGSRKSRAFRGWG